MSFIPVQGKLLSKDEIKTIIKEENVRFIRLQFVDINGTVKNMAVPCEQIDKVLNNECMLDGSSIKGFRNIETSDMCFYPDLSTFSLLPWRENVEEGTNVARIICDIYNPDGTPFEGCPRANLKKVIKEASDLGYVLNVGPEAEFFLFNKDEWGQPTLETHDDSGYYDVAPNDKGESVRGKMVETLKKMGFDIEASHHESAAGQHEIDFKYADALTTADNVTSFKYAVRAVASKNDLYATFMPKPIVGINGSGMHCNISLFKNGKNAFYDADAPYQLSKEAMNVIGALLSNIRGFAAITNPLVNSYKRLVPGYEAPVYLAWSLANRSALIRVPAKRGNATRVELRSPDPSCNPYLAFAVILKTAIEGIKSNAKTPQPTEENIYNLTQQERESKGILSLPGSLEEALYELKRNKLVQSALGNHIYHEFLIAKEKEWDDYRTQVTDWEIENYL